MKEWFKNLKHRKLIIVILMVIHIISLFIIGGIGDAEGPGAGLMSLIFTGSGFFGVLFIVFETKIKNEEPKESIVDELQSKEKIDEIIVSNDKCNKVVKENKVIESNKNIDNFLNYNDVWYVIKYCYRENLCFVENLDKFKLEDTNITFQLEADNQYDKNTVAVYIGEHKIGLMFNGNCRDIVIRCLKKEKYKIGGFVCKKDDENKQVAVQIAFFEELELRKSFVTSIINTSKKDEYGNKRQENIEFLNEGDDVYFTENIGEDNLLVIDKYVNELGEINQSTSDKILEDTDDLDDIIGIVEELTYTDTLKVKAKIRIYLTEYKD